MFRIKIGKITFTDGIRKMSRKDFDNAFNFSPKALDAKWEELQKAITKYNKANNIEPVITQEEIDEAFEEFVEKTEEVKEKKKKKKKSSKS